MPFCFKYLITGAGYSDAYYQIPILLIAAIFNIIVSLMGSVYVALKKSNEIAKTSVLAAIINIIINILFINKIGLYAASVSTLIAYLAMAVYRYIDVQKYVKIKINKKNVYILSLTLIIVLIEYYIRKTYLCIIGLLLTILIAVIINKNILKNIKLLLIEFLNKLSHKHQS